MIITRIVLIIVTVILTIIFLKVFNFGVILAGILTVIVVILGYIIYANIRQRRRYNLLEQDLDPEAFIKATERQIEITGKNKQAYAMLNADLFVGLLSMRKYNEARDILDEIDVKYLSRFNGSILIYYNNEMSLYFNTGEIDKAKEIYEAKIKKYPIKILNESIIMYLILANKSFYDKEYNISKELYNQVLKNTKSRRLKLEIYYILAEIDEKEGKIEEAIQKYKKVADKGNKLYSSFLAKEKLKLFE